jgi:general secretion pathway protein H
MLLKRFITNSRRRAVGGFTLFEIIVAMAVVGLIMGVAVSQMGNLLERDMKKASNKMAATIRYLYNKAATESLYIRLVMDMDEQAYWVEATADPVAVARIDEDTKNDEEEEAEELEEGEVPKLKPHKPRFGQVDSYLLKPSKLPGSVFFKDVYVEHRPGAVEAGKVALYFFPNGFVEEAVINLRNEDDDVFYSLKTSPISGRVGIESEYRRLEEQ